MAEEKAPKKESGSGGEEKVAKKKSGSKGKMPQSKAASGAVQRAGGAASRGAGKVGGKSSQGMNDNFDDNPSDDFLDDQAAELTQEAGDAANEVGQAAKDTVDTVKDVGRDIKDGVDRHRKKKEEEERKKKEEEEKKKEEEQKKKEEEEKKKQEEEKKNQNEKKEDGGGGEGKKEGENADGQNGNQNQSGDTSKKGEGTQKSGDNAPKGEGAKNTGDAAKNTGDAAKNTGNTAQKGGDVAKNGANTAKNGGEAVGNAGKTAGDAASKTGQAVEKGAQAGAQAAEKSAQAAQKASEMAQKAAEAAAKAAQKAVQIAREVIKAAIEAIKAAAQAIAEAVEAIIAFIAEFWWLILIILAVILIIVLILWLCGVFGDSESVTGDVLTDHESLREENNLVVDNNQQAHQVDISAGSKIISAYYTYYSTKSIWVLFDGMVYNCRSDKTSKDTSIDLSKMPKETVIIDGKSYQIVKPVQYGSSEFIEIYQYDPFTGSGLGIDGREILQDKFERESSFYLSADALISIDEALHNGDFRYPEQLVQKVKYKVVIDNPDTGEYHYELDNLADENGVLFKENVTDESGKIVNYATLSTAYTQDGNATGIDDNLFTWGLDYDGLWIPVTDTNGKVTKKISGVWDYGFGSILHYLKYIEAHENRGEVVSFQVLHKGVWDTSDDNLATTKIPYDLSWEPGDSVLNDINVGKYLSTQNYKVTLYKNATIETLTYAEWSALSEEEKANYFTGRGKDGDPTHAEFNKNRVYGLPSTTSYMIDWVVTPAGTMTTQVQAVWKDSGLPFAVVENDGGVDYSDEEFNGEEGFDNGNNNTYVYNDEKVVVQTITSHNDGKATFSWSDSNISSSSGTLLVNPTTRVYFLRYVETGDATVDGRFNYSTTSYTTVDGVKQYHMNSHSKIVSMFNTNGTCKNCGDTATKVTYSAVSHNNCKQNYKIKLPVYVNGTKTTETRDYLPAWTGSVAVNQNTGAITSKPYAYVPEGYNKTGSGAGATYTLRWNDINRDGYNNDIKKTLIDVTRCWYCNQLAYSASYVRNAHSNCLEVRYNYDLIDTEEVKVNDANWGLIDGYIQLIRNVEGTKWDKEPSYASEPDTSQILGKKYYEDYFNNYSTWVPTSVQSDFNFDLMQNQTGLDEDGLLKLLEREPIGDAVAVLGGIEDYFVDGVYEIDDDGKIHGYIGPGVSVIAFEQGCPGSESADREIIEKGVTAQPNSVSTLALEGFPNYGVCQMNRGTLEGFKTWMLEDNDRADMWYKIFGDITVDTTSETTAFSIAWRDSFNVLSDDEYVTFMIYQLAYSYYWSMANQHDKWANHVPEYEDSRAIVELFWMMANNGSLSRALNHASLGSALFRTPDQIIDKVCDAAATHGLWGNYTDVMRVKFNTNIRRFYHSLSSYELPVFEWDEETKMFSDVGGTKGGWSVNRLWNKLTGAKTDDAGNTYYPWQKLYKNSQVQIVQYTTSDGHIVYGSKDANSAIPRNEFKVNSVSANDIDHEIAKIFATADKVPISTYTPLTDDFFVLRYQELFSSDLSRRWSVGKKGIATYLPDGWTGVFNKLSTSTDPNDTDYRDMKYTIVTEYNKKENPTIKALVVYGGRNAVDADGNPVDVTPQPIAIHNVSLGTILEFGTDPDLGGTYIAVQYKKSVVYYGNVTPSDDLKVGDTVDKRRLIGFVQSGDFLYLTMKTSVSGTYIDPTPLLKGGLYELVEEARKYLGFDYEWGGHGPVSCFSPRCCKEADHRSYVDGVKWAFDCSGLVTYCCRALEMKKDGSSTGWEALGAAGYANIGEDVTNDYMAGGAIDWYSVPAGTLVFFDWDGGGIDHVGIWSGEESLVHASGGNPYAEDENGYMKDESGNYIVDAPEKNHAPNDCMIKEYFMGAVPADAYNSPYAIENGYNPLRANMFGDYYKSKVVALVDISMYLTDSNAEID